ncbi:ADP-ribose pyrophosphatase YjhB, NUDIX family [Paraburkholderia diazotrophica]|uniref:ADP-ribose pyrophosphatase YjhB, NUDIX family n=1 Tax=Paraburkholderia diazotrophica TaxID=667676 RepID=A0A1H7CNC4_9BURK|nr:ADP-ribose pyrophosphatase YjhB, NUDIX family [Paraburkholderia diazotrophica]
MKILFPLVTADIALFTVQDRNLRVLMVKRANDPELGKWALPGGILNPATDADLDETAQRVLSGKTGVDVPFLEQVATFSGATRDPRGWSLSVLYYALLPSDQVHAVAGRATDAIEWRDAFAPGSRLAFDHAALIRAALATLRDKVDRAALPLHLLPARFTLTELQQTCESILGRSLDKSVFRRRLKDEPGIEQLAGEFLYGAQRPAQLYRAADGFRF